MELWYPELFLRTFILKKGREIVEVDKKRKKGRSIGSRSHDAKIKNVLDLSLMAIVS